jgi:hypothetical protein
MVKNDIVDLAQLLVVQAIQMRAANIVGRVRDAGVFQSAVVCHFFLLVLPMFTGVDEMKKHLSSSMELEQGRGNPPFTVGPVVRRVL